MLLNGDSIPTKKRGAKCCETQSPNERTTERTREGERKMEKLSSISIGRGMEGGKEGGAGSVFTVRGGERVNGEEGLGYSDRKKRSP